MRRLLIIGIGSGDPEHVTVQAIRAMNRADVFLVMDKGPDKDELAQLRREVLARYVESQHRIVEVPDPPRILGGPSYEEDIRAWHEQRIALYERLLGEEIPDGGTGAILAWGDPALYDSTLRLVEEMRQRGRVAFEVEVLPGISSVQVLAARHAIPLHAVGEPVRITTGRRLAAGEDHDGRDLVVMLDSREAFTGVDPEGVEIFWGAYLGTEDEILISGPLAEVADEIVRVRRAAAEAKGWMFDTYLLRRTGRS